MIYFAKATSNGLIKIGYSSNPEKRMAGLAHQVKGSVELLKTFVGDRRHERHLHAKFAVHREFGEWFRPAIEILSFIATADAIEGAFEAKFPNRIQVEVDIDLRDRIKDESGRTKRPALYEAAELIKEALDARDKKAGRK